MSGRVRMWAVFFHGLPEQVYPRRAMADEVAIHLNRLCGRADERVTVQPVDVCWPVLAGLKDERMGTWRGPR